MTVKTSGKFTAEFIVSEANGYRSRAVGTLLSGQTIVAGEVLSFNDAGTKLIAWDGDVDTAGAIGEECAGIALDNYDATGGDMGGIVYLARDAEVNIGELTFPSGTEAVGAASLAKLGIICRTNAIESPET